MSLFIHIWNKFISNKNVTFCITFFTAVIASVLNIYEYTSQTKIGSAILGVLACLAMGLLGIRHAIEKIGASNKKNFLTHFSPKRMRKNLTRANELLLIGTHLKQLLSDYSTVFREKLLNGDHIKVLILHPDGAAREMSEMRFSIGKGIIDETNEIQTSLRILKTLHGIAPKKMEVKTLDYLFGYEAFIVNPKSSNGVVYFTKYTFKTPDSPNKPKFIYTPKEEEWYDLICSEAVSLWESGKKYNF